MTVNFIQPKKSSRWQRVAITMIVAVALLAGGYQAYAALTFTATAITSDGDVTINGVAASIYAIGAATTGGTITIGGTAQTGAIAIGDTAASTVTEISLGGGNGIKTINIGDGTGANTITIGAATSTGVSITDNNWSVTAAGVGTLVSLATSAQNIFSAAAGTAPVVARSATATDDDIRLLPQAGGAGRFAGIFTTADLTADITWTLPATTGNVAVDTAGATAGNVLLETEIDASSELLALMDDETGTGALVFASTPTLVTPVLGAATGTSINLGGTTLLDVLNVVTAAIDLASAATNQCVSGTSTAVTQTIALGDSVIVSPSVDDAAWDNGSLTAFVEAAGTPGTIKIVFCADTDGADPASMTYELTVLQF